MAWWCNQGSRGSADIDRLAVPDSLDEARAICDMNRAGWRTAHCGGGGVGEGGYTRYCNDFNDVNKEGNLLKERRAQKSPKDKTVSAFRDESQKLRGSDGPSRRVYR